MRMVRLFFLGTLATLTLATFGFAPGAQAAEQTLRLDPKSTKIDFLLPATGHDVHGSFALQSGEIRFDNDTGKADGSLVIDATVAKTGSGSRDKTMHQDVLESGKFPTFVFTAERLEGTVAETGESSVTLVGKLAIHGADHPFALPAKVKRQGSEVTASVAFKIPFITWGMKDPSILFLSVDKEVQIKVEAQGQLAASTQQAGAGR